MVFALVTQSRGDARRLAEWVTYHSRLGFEEFHVVLDGLVDDSDQVLASLDVGARIHVHHRSESGEYQADMDQAERWRVNKQWRADNAELLASLPFRCQDPLSLRQGLNISPLLDEITAGRRGWVAFIDVDEFIALPRDGSIAALVRRINAEKRTSRISFLNFNVDTEGHDPALPVLEQHSVRWSREDILAHPDPAWGRRYKTMARFKAATPYGSVHKINRGPRVVVDPDEARLLHYRTPAQRMVPHVPYTVHDPLTMPPEPAERPGTQLASTSPLTRLARRVRTRLQRT